MKWGGNVNKIKSQIIHNLKKDKGAYISFGIVILFTALMLNLAFVLVFQVDNAYNEKFTKLNTATMNICISKMQDIDQLSQDLEEIEGVGKVESREAVFLETVVKDFRNTDFSMNTVFYNMNETRSVNKLEIKEENEIISEQSIYIPLYVASFGEFELNEEIIYEVGGEKNSFQVSGVLEEMQYGNYGKGLMGAYLPEETYREFAKKYANNIVVEYSIMTDGSRELIDVQNKVSSLLGDKGIVMLTNCDSVSTKSARTMVCNLLILILIVFALVILLVSVFLCKFRISNSIEADMINMGVLKAIGYTGNMIIAGMVLPYVIVTVAAALLGIIVSYQVLPILSQMLTLQAGFSFTLTFDVKSLMCVEVLLACIVIVFTYTSAKRIKKLQPIHAIRGNGDTKRIRRNYFPLSETLGKTQILLILKQMFACGKQNLLLFGVSFVLTILVAFASTLFYNVIVEPNNFISTLSEEMPEIVFYPKKEQEDLFLEKLQSNSKIENVLKYTTGTVYINDELVTSFVCEDFSKVSNDLCYIGENPKEKGEIALGSAFEEKYNLGDKIEIENGDISCIYEVTGFVQSVNYQGNICEFTIEGYEALSAEDMVPSLYVYLQDKSQTEQVMEEIEEGYGSMIESANNYQKMTKTTQEMYAGITSIVIIVIFILTILIVLFILYIVIKSLLVQRKQELGIYKAMGYSNWQLMVQMAGSFLPASVIAVLLSSALGIVYMPQMNQFIFQTVGAMKNNMEVSFVFLMVFAFIQIMIHFTISICLTMPIKKISAYALIKE